MFNQPQPQPQPQSLPPGFRFFPTDEELIVHYLRNRATSAPCPAAIAAEIDIYKFDPWELPEKALFGDREWYFFTPRDRKYPNGVRPNRSAASGYWKATGTDKPIGDGNESIGVKKALVFYQGRPPKGLKTNWIMHEYRLPDARSSNTYRPVRLREASMRLDDWVLCRIYKKSSSLPSDNSGASEEVSQPAGLAKSLSVSDYLDDYSAISHLFDEMPAENIADVINSNGKQPFIDSNYLVQQLSQTGSSVSSGNYLKRQRAVAAEEEIAFPSKRMSEPCCFTNLGNQFDGPQHNNLMNHQSLLTQQLLLNSHLGLH